MWTLLEFLDNFKINLRANDQKKDQLGVKRFKEGGVFSGNEELGDEPGSSKEGPHPREIAVVYIISYLK